MDVAYGTANSLQSFDPDSVISKALVLVLLCHGQNESKVLALFPYQVTQI